MKRNLSRIARLFAAALIGMALMASAAGAAESVTLPAEVSIPVTVSLDGTLPDPEEDYSIVLTAQDSTCPMPDGQKGGSYALTITGAGEGSFDIEFDSLGVYYYTISQAAGDNEDCAYDASVYSLTVSVVNSDLGGYAIVAALYDDSTGGKVDSADFLNEYEVVPEATTEAGEVTETGVGDMWIIYGGGAAALLAAAVVIVLLLLRKEDKSYEEK